MQNNFYVYIMTNKENQVLYTGVTGDLMKRIFQHREKQIKGFTSRYNVTKLVYFETCCDPGTAITREKQIKNGSRKKKIRMIEGRNPEWADLYHEIASHR